MQLESVTLPEMIDTVRRFPTGLEYHRFLDLSSYRASKDTMCYLGSERKCHPLGWSY